MTADNYRVSYNSTFIILCLNDDSDFVNLRSAGREFQSLEAEGVKEKRLAEVRQKGIERF